MCLMQFGLGGAGGGGANSLMLLLSGLAGASAGAVVFSCFMRRRVVPGVLQFQDRSK